jgi:ASC-1-like (ASCH) protein
MNAKTRKLLIRDNVLDWIASGGKTLEVRVGYRNIRSVKVGDSLILASSRRELRVRVEAIRRYSTFSQMVQAENVEQIAPGMSREQVVRRLDDLFGDNVQLGVIVFQIVLTRAPSTSR